MKGKPPRLSIVEMVQQVLPGDTNPHGTVFGGKVMEWLDIAGAVAAMRHTQNPVVTASFDRENELARRAFFVFIPASHIVLDQSARIVG